MNEVKEVQRREYEERVWFSFFATYPVLDCEANVKLLDSYLTNRLQSVLPETLKAAFEAIKGQLVLINSDALAGRQTRVPVPEAPATLSSPVIAEAGPDSEVPKEFTRKKILSEMNSETYRALVKKYGAVAVEFRVNKAQREDQ